MSVTILDDSDAGQIAFTSKHLAIREGVNATLLVTITRIGLDEYETPATVTFETVGKSEIPIAQSEHLPFEFTNARLLELLEPFEFEASAGQDFAHIVGNVTFKQTRGDLRNNMIVIEVPVLQDDLFEYPGECVSMTGPRFPRLRISRRSS